VLYSIERAGSAQPDVAHVADIEDADASADRHVLGDDPAADRCWVLDGHIPAIEFDHLCAQRAMHAIERGLAH
jgi:hypothetical protein